MSRRLYQVAALLGLPSRVLTLYLQSLSRPIPSASSYVDADLERALLATRVDEIRTVARTYAILNPQEPGSSWYVDDDEWSDPAGVQPEFLTTPQAAAACWVTPATIRQWVVRGHLTPAGRRGRVNVFRRADLVSTYEGTRARTKRTQRWATSFPPLVPDARRGVTSANLGELVTVAEGACNAGVPAATVRSWVHRGLITPVDRRGRTPLFLRADVLTTARRSPYRPRRKPPLGF